MLCSHVCAALYLQFEVTFACAYIKPIFHLATFFARRQAKTRIRQHDWLKLAGEKIRREQVGSVPTFLSVRANKFAKWKIDLIVFNDELKRSVKNAYCKPIFLYVKVVYIEKSVVKCRCLMHANWLNKNVNNVLIGQKSLVVSALRRMYHIVSYLFFSLRNRTSRFFYRLPLTLISNEVLLVSSTAIKNALSNFSQTTTHISQS